MSIKPLNLDPPYYAVTFVSQRVPEDEEAYQTMAELMESLALQQPGFLGLESVRDNEGKGITVSYWTDLESIARWKQEQQHLQAQRKGMERWYSAYQVQVSRVEKAYEYTR